MEELKAEPARWHAYQDWVRDQESGGKALLVYFDEYDNGFSKPLPMGGDKPV